MKFTQNSFSDIFNNAINSYNLREIHMSGGCFTWTNNQKLPTLEKLDRVLMNKEWEKLFPMAIIHKIPREFSDDNPLMVNSQSCS
jgi:hypothetical protein